MKKLSVIVVLSLVFGFGVSGQEEGDYRSSQTGNWDVIANWDVYSAFDFMYVPASSYPGNNTTNKVTIGTGTTMTVPNALTLTNPGNPIEFEGSSTLIIDGTINMANIINNIGTATITVNGNLNMTNFIYGGSITTLFSNININGTLTTTTILNCDNIIIGAGGRFETSWYHSSAQSQGWWFSTYAPSTTGSSILGTVEFNGATVQNIATLIPYKHLEISTGGTTVSGDLIVNDTLLINTGASLDIGASTNATIDTLIITDANSLMLNSGSSLEITGLLTGTGAATVEVQRLVTEDAWHLISVPHSDYTMTEMTTENTIDVHNTTSHVALGYFNEGTGAWVTSTTPTGNMNPGQGYITGVSDPANTTLSFTGTPNYGSQTNVLAIVNTNKAVNATGNPYTSAIDADLFLANTGNAAAIDDNYSAMYTYDPVNNEYDPNGGLFGQDFIQSCQGFLLKADSDGGSISFTTSMQAHSTDAFFKKSTKEENYSLLGLTIDDGTKTKQTKIYFNQTATKGLDPGMDLGIIKRSPDFNIYTSLVEDNGVDFIYQSLPNNDFNNLSIPIGIDNIAGGLITFSTETFSLPTECLAILEDRELEVFTDLKAPDAQYLVDLPANTTGTGRFFLHTFNPQTVNVDMDDLQNITIFAFNKEIIVQGEISEMGRADIYDLSGRMVKSAVLESGNRHVIPASELQEGIYIVRLNVEGKTKLSKLFLH